MRGLGLAFDQESYSGISGANEMIVFRLGELLDMAKTVRAKKLVKQKAKQCKCLQCDAEAVPGRRGLCQYHYNQFDNQIRKLSPKKRKAFDCEQVAKGMIFESRRGKAPRSPNPFAIIPG